MMRLILIACIVCCIAYLSPTREHTDVATQIAATLSGVETLAALASSPLVSSGVGGRVIAEAIRRPHAPVAESRADTHADTHADTRADRLANAADRPYR